MEGSMMLRVIMMPANAVCDAAGVTDEHERGMLRMLVNMLICSAVAVIAFAIGWKLSA